MADHSHDPTLIPPTITFLAPPEKTGDIGRLAQYRILKQLGRGGMGVVYQGLDTELNRVAALKVMHPEYAASEEARVRFKREAQAAAKLKHDHIVTIYQVGEERQIPFLAMEFLAGKSLDEWLRPDRRASVAETLLIGKQIAKGLAAAHKAGLVHRDIKPANLWLEAPRGRVKILDFGLARNAAPDKADLTQYGSVVGTPAYMAPEQARGEAVDHRCDLFSLGCVLYRMLAGRLPFQGDSTFAILSAIASETPPPLSQLRPEIPARLSDLVSKLLAKPPQDRPKSAQVVFDELVEIERESKEPVAPPLLEPTPRQASPPRPLLVGLSVIAVLIAVLFVAWLASGKRDSVVVQPSPAETIPERAQAIDLIELIEPIRSSDSGNVTKPSPRQLELESRDKGFKAVIPWTPPEEYDLKMKVTRQANGPGQLRIGLSQGEHRFVMVIDHKHNDKFRSGPAYVDGKFIENRGEKPIGKVLRAEERDEVVVEVRKDRAVLRVNGSMISDWKGNFSDLSRESLMTNEPLILEGNRESHFLFDELVLEPLGDDAGHPFPEHSDLVDLIPLIDLTRDGRRGSWSVPEPGQLLGKAEDKPLALVLPWTPPREYRLRMKVTRRTRQPTQGLGRMRVGLAQGDLRFAAMFDHKTDKGFLSGLALVDNADLESQSNVHHGLVLLPNRPIELMMTVRQEHFDIRANGTQIYEWNGDLSRSNRPRVGLETPLNIMALDSMILFEEIKLEPLGDDPGQPYVKDDEKR